MKWRARTVAGRGVAIEYSTDNAEWHLARMMSACEADELGAALRAAAQESVRTAMKFASARHGGDCDEFPHCPCAKGRTEQS